jgi:hypothetical protein
MRALSGNKIVFDQLRNSDLSDDPIIETFEWILSQKSAPKLMYNRWAVLDEAIKWSEPGRPCYEFGVWMGASLKYLMRSFELGFGFDTFDGLPENWRSVSKGSYSSFTRVPEIPNVEFIIGEFKDTLPNFFSSDRPMAGLINFDADLYSSTLTALMNSTNVIDEKTILVFDELIVNDGWQQDEYRALKEFCSEKSYTYEILAASIFTKQVVCRLRKA